MVGVIGGVTSVVCTRGRPDSLAVAVASLLRCDPRAEHVLVLDQSDDDRALALIRALPDGDQVDYRLLSTRGLSTARNEAIRVAHGDIVVFTDDDCEASTDLIAQHVGAVERHPNAAIVFGTVTLPRPLESDEWAARFDAADSEFVGRIPTPADAWGIGANMALVRSRLDGARFDPLLGAGAILRSGEEVDLVVRVVAGGRSMVTAAAPKVIHHGIRSGGNARSITYSYALGVGAATCKHARLRLRPGAGLVVSWPLDATRSLARRVVQRARGGSEPLGVWPLVGLVRGVLAGATRPLDRSTGCFSADARPSLRASLHGARELVLGR